MFRNETKDGSEWVATHWNCPSLCQYAVTRLSMTHGSKAQSDQSK